MLYSIPILLKQILFGAPKKRGVQCSVQGASIYLGFLVAEGPQFSAYFRLVEVGV